VRLGAGVASNEDLVRSCNYLLAAEELYARFLGSPFVIKMTVRTSCSLRSDTALRECDAGSSKKNRLAPLLESSRIHYWIVTVIATSFLVGPMIASIVTLPATPVSTTVSGVCIWEARFRASPLYWAVIRYPPGEPR
jgi:hypothetical protein